MPGRVCWFCERHSNMRNVWEGVVAKVEEPSLHDAMSVYICDSCSHVSIALRRVDSRYTHLSGARSVLEGPGNEGDVVWLPLKPFGKQFPDVPGHIAEAASEVHCCLSVGAFRAAVALARAVVEATAKDKGIASGNLYAKIDALAEQGHLRGATREAAHEVRLDGNEVAHGDLALEPLSGDEADDIAALMDEVLEEVYQGPARTARVRANRAARKASGVGDQSA